MCACVELSLEVLLRSVAYVCVGGVAQFAVLSRFRSVASGLALDASMCQSEVSLRSVI